MPVMDSATGAYLKQEASAYRIDVRSKILMLTVYSVSIFFVGTWWGMAAFAAMFAAALVASHVDVRKVFKVAIPVYVIAAVTIVFNVVTYVNGVPVVSFDGFLRGCFFALRILLLVWASLVLCLTTTSEALTRAFNSLLSPLRTFHVPTEDIATVLSIALRFIPLTVEEFFFVRDAQWSRGAPLNEGSPIARLKAHGAIFIPMFIAMFRRADRLALAMDARCYGMPGVDVTELREAGLGAVSVAVMAISFALCIVVAVLL